MYGWFTIIHVFTIIISCYSVELEVRMSAPTYKELIQLLNEAESVTSNHHSVLSTAESTDYEFLSPVPTYRDWETWNVPRNCLTNK